MSCFAAETRRLFRGGAGTTSARGVLLETLLSIALNHKQRRMEGSLACQTSRAMLSTLVDDGESASQTTSGLV